MQFATPDAMRGRVNAVDMLFIGASNELGEFESGLTAHWFGTVPAVVLGGVGTLIVIGLWAWLFPELRRVDHCIQFVSSVQKESSCTKLFARRAGTPVAPSSRTKLGTFA